MKTLINHLLILSALLLSSCANTTISNTDNTTKNTAIISEQTTENIQTYTAQKEYTNNQEETAYIININTQKFHYPNCYCVNKMKEKNKLFFKGNRNDIIAKNYFPCSKCNP